MTMALIGHRAMVTALHESAEDHLLASGSEDCSVRLWDLRASSSCVRRLACSDAVARIAKRPNGGDWLVASGNAIYSYDLRNDQRLLVPQSAATRVLQSTDDINDFDFTSSSSSLVCANDVGEIHYQVYNNSDNSDSIFEAKRTRHKTSVVTSSRMMSDALVLSGGFDNELVLSNIKTGKAVFRGSLPQLYTFNPPHVYAIDVLRSVSMACVGVGDGSLVVMRNAGDARAWQRNWGRAGTQLELVHMAGTCCVHFMLEDGSRVGSAGSDKTLSVTAVKDEGLELVHQVCLPHKPNCLHFSRLQDNTVFVGDTSCEIQVLINVG